VWLLAGGGSLTALLELVALFREKQRKRNSLKPPLKEGDQPTVQWILQQPGGVNVNAGGEQNGWTALHLASLCGHVAIVQAILQVDGVHVNARTVEGVTHLHIACCAAH